MSLFSVVLQRVIISYLPMPMEQRFSTNGPWLLKNLVFICVTVVNFIFVCLFRGFSTGNHEMM